ncbi:MAG: electron transfer flavoprotein subunit alpha/FixB family protein [Treponema sp.]|jgi:electron transfer flavoprotein alpha subunit|nr:electron transfer flavoprotein subunit alpha/FixB family protein [Treponema sp.]
MIPYTKSEAEKLILTLLQSYGGGAHPISLELAGAARRLAAGRGFKTAGVFIAGGRGSELSSVAEAQLKSCGLEEVYLYQDKRFCSFIPELHAAVLLRCIEDLRPSIFLVGATPEGRCLAPLLAVPLETGVTADCTELSLDDGDILIQTRPAFGGELMARIITPESRPQIATVRYGIFRGGEMAGNARILPVETGAFLPPQTQVEEITALSTGEKEADYVLALGGGIRAREDIGLFKRMSEAMGSMLMCSRSLVERGWLPQSLQIGLSGRCIAPRLLVTLGISGSVQFMAGVQGAKKICAVNTDPGAPILRVADMPLICDLYQVAEAYGY